jgi:hypothetical protein
MIRAAPKAESLGEDFLEDARVVAPRGKTSVHPRIDSDIVEGFKAHGIGASDAHERRTAGLCRCAKGEGVGGRQRNPAIR